MDLKRRHILVGAILFTMIIGALAVVIVLSNDHGERWDGDIRFDFTTTIDSRNNTLTMVEENETVNWSEYLVVVNNTMIMKRSTVAVPGVSTTFVDNSWAPEKGCLYDIEVVIKENRKAIWNGTVKASR